MRLYLSLVLFAAVLITPLSASAQEYADLSKTTLSDGWIIPLKNARFDARISQKAKEFQDKRLYSNVEFVRLQSIADIQRDGVITFEVPGNGRSYSAKAKMIEAESKEDYIWGGDIVDGLGEMTVVSDSGQITAHISTEDKSYQIHPVDGEVHAIVELAEVEEVMDSTQSCVVLPTPSGGSTIPDDVPENGRIIACNDRTVRVLVLYTDRASQATNNVQGVAQLAVSQFNQAQSNSRVNNSFRLELAGIARYGLNESNARTDLTLLAGDDTGLGNAHTLREAAGADAVILFTNGSYNDTYGLAFLGPDEDFAYGLVQITSATSSRYTFVHELGHIFGANHQTCGDFGVSGCATFVAGDFNYGYSYEIRNGFLQRRDRYHTVVHQLRSRYDPILHFSNPGVNYDGRPTGTNTRDNARTIEVNDAIIAGFDNTATLSASIDGPSRVDQPYVTNVWEAVVSCGNAASGYSYRWEYSNDGFNYFSGGTRETFAWAAYPGSTSSTTLYIRLRVTSGGQSRSAFRSVYVPANNARTAVASRDSLVWGETVDLSESEGVLLEDVFPNPSHQQVNFGFYLPEQQAIRLDVLDVNGRVVRNVAAGEFDHGSHEFTMDGNEIPSGVYFYQLVTKNTKLTKRLLIGDK